MEAEVLFLHNFYLLHLNVQAIAIQCLSRRKFAQIKATKLRLIFRARTCIRHAILGYATRCRFLSTKMSAIKIQRCVRIFLIRSSLENRILDRKKRNEVSNKFMDGKRYYVD